MHFFLILSTLTQENPKVPGPRTPYLQAQGHLLRLENLQASLVVVESRQPHPCLPSSAPRALSQSQLPCQAPLLPPPPTPHNTKFTTLLLFGGSRTLAAAPLRARTSWRGELPGLANLLGNHQKVPLDIPVTLRSICMFSILHSTMSLESEILLWLHSRTKEYREGAPALRDLLCFGFSPGSLYFRM